ncbi:MAG: 16S rRNA (guanine(966)-N(2))-methyltransferase RsmD [Candidatus Ruminococcus intestinipullorum]|nr:16S rRNA (guanine(966)-N(2))-methyltransferase RsmD [Candidatus Ruminococcus intestinipullorum]
MRVIAGSAKRLQLKTLEGIETRPTTDRIKETLFNMISPSIIGCRFLDLFSGSGAIGIEALSRGAKEAVFVEKNPKAMDCIKENLRFTKLDQRAFTLTKDVLLALQQLDGEKIFDIVFMDPPYDLGFEKNVLEYLAESQLLEEDAIVIVEASKQTDFSYINDIGFTLIKEKLYKTNKHVFLEKITR